jgi:hypothetical protein
MLSITHNYTATQYYTALQGFTHNYKALHSTAKYSVKATCVLTPPISQVRCYKAEGVDGLWKGLVPNLALVSNPTIHFFTYGTVSSNPFAHTNTYTHTQGAHTQRTHVHAHAAAI